jgi:hypothetical protein
VEVQPERSAVDVEPVTAAATAGGTGYLNLSVTNTGTGPYTDVTVALFPGGPISSPADEVAIDRLDAGGAETVSMPVAASAGAVEKAYPALLIVKYDDPSGERRTADTVRTAIDVVAPAEESGGVGAAPVVGLVVVLAALGFGVYRWRGRGG